MMSRGQLARALLECVEEDIMSRSDAAELFYEQMGDCSFDVEDFFDFAERDRKMNA
jgi:hypothetical protein